MNPADERWLGRAVSLARLCTPSNGAYSVGCVIVGDAGRLELSSGYSREISPTAHAEESALTKLGAAPMPAGAVLYSSLEPCSVRLSGRRSCTDRILASGIRRVVYVLREPRTFVRCEGHAELERAGVEVTQYEGSSRLTALARAINAHLADLAQPGSS